MSRLRRAESVGSIASGLWGRLDRTGEGATKARAIAAWRTVAGDEVAAHARGFALRDRELLVFVDSAVWANELSVLSENYRVAVNERLGKELVGSLRFTVSRKVEEGLAEDAEDERRDAAAAPHERVEPVAATEAELEQVRRMAAVVADPALREAVTAAAVAHLEWRKGIEAHSGGETAVQRATGTDSQSLL
jgi:hypothetical protein